jgi:hypothetical protein
MGTSMIGKSEGFKIFASGFAGGMIGALIALAYFDPEVRFMIGMFAARWGIFY